MKLILATTTTLLLSIALLIYFTYDKFNQEHFKAEAFNIDLNQYLKQYEHEEKNGLLIIKGVSSSDEIHKLLFEGEIIQSKEYVPATYYGKRIGNEGWGPTTTKKWKSFDKYSQLSIYYANSKTLLLGYFDSYGG